MEDIDKEHPTVLDFFKLADAILSDRQNNPKSVFNPDNNDDKDLERDIRDADRASTIFLSSFYSDKKFNRMAVTPILEVVTDNFSAMVKDEATKMKYY